MAWFAGVVLALQSLALYVRLDKLGADAHAYWATGLPGPLYGVPPGGVDAYLYSPAFAQAIAPLTALPWPWFLAVWIAAEVAVFLWLLYPLGWQWAMPLTLWCASEWAIGNIVPFLAAAAVLGMTRPGSWALVALTKPTMAFGPVWYAARGEWGKLLRFAGVTAGILLLSVLLWPGAWADWLQFLKENGADQAGERGLYLRVAIAIAVAIWAARTSNRWVLAIAMLIATPVLAGAASLTILSAIPRLLLEQSRPSSRTGSAAEGELHGDSSG